MACFLTATNLSSSQFIDRVKTAGWGCVCITLSRMMNIENTLNETADSAVTYRFSEDGKVAEWKPATICYTRIRKTIPQYKRLEGADQRWKLSKLLRVGAGKSSTSATDTNNTSVSRRSTTKWTTYEIWG